MTLIREARSEDCPSILDLIRELATYEREPDAVVNTVEALEAHLFGAAIAFYEAIGSHGMDGWNTRRLDGDALLALAAGG